MRRLEALFRPVVAVMEALLLPSISAALEGQAKLFGATADAIRDVALAGITAGIQAVVEGCLKATAGAMEALQHTAVHAIEMTARDVTEMRKDLRKVREAVEFLRRRADAS